MSNSKNNLFGTITLKNYSKTKGQWYYVHFKTDEYTEIQSNFDIKPNDEIISKTFLLFLTQNQVESISDSALVMPIDPKNKYYEDGGNIEKTDFLYISVLKNYKIPMNSNFLYNIKQISDESYIITFEQKDINIDQFIQMKKDTIQYLIQIPEIKKCPHFIKFVFSKLYDGRIHSKKH